MVSFGIVEDAPWPFYAIFPVFFLTFVLIPGSLGSRSVRSWWRRSMPRRQKTVLGIGLGGVGPRPDDRHLRLADLEDARRGCSRPTGSTASSAGSSSADTRSGPADGCRSGLVASVRGDWSTGLFYLGASSPRTAGCRLPDRGGDRPRPLPVRLTVGSRGADPRVEAIRAGTASTPAFHRVFFFLPNPIRLLILKDLRTFRRDPAQWSQFLIFFGLLAFYFINIRRLS